MHPSILEVLAIVITNIISNLGYGGVFALMTIESALIPIPSEVIMPFSGFLASQGRFSLWGVAIAGALGNLFGSLIAYSIGYWGHKALVRKLVVKYGKFILLSEEEFDSAVSIFSKYGQTATAIARVLPAIRTVISLPAGIAKINIWKFSILTFFGSLIWSYMLAFIGFKLGQNWQKIRPMFEKFDIAIVSALIILIGVYIYHKLRKRSRRS